MVGYFHGKGIQRTQIRFSNIKRGILLSGRSALKKGNMVCSRLFSSNKIVVDIDDLHMTFELAPWPLLEDILPCVRFIPRDGNLKRLQLERESLKVRSKS